MSSNSEQIGVGTNRGFLSKCMCGLDVKVFTSKTQDNPGRPFFRCRSKKDDHLFKWVEDAVFEEVQDALPKVGAIESDISHAKFEIEELKAVIEDLKEDVMCKKEIWKLKLMTKFIFVCVCVLGIVIIYQMFGKGKVKNVFDH